MCRTDTRLATKADTWFSGCTKKVMFQKHTGTAILLRCLILITVHEGAMSIVHYRTLTAKPLLRVFHLSCNKHVWYKKPYFRSVLGLRMYWGKQRRIQQHAASFTVPLPHLHHVASSGSCKLSGKIHKQSKVLMWFSAAELVQKEAPQPKQHSLKSGSSPDFSVSTQLNTDKSEMQRNRIHTSWKWAFSLCLAI